MTSAPDPRLQALQEALDREPKARNAKPSADKPALGAATASPGLARGLASAYRIALELVVGVVVGLVVGLWLDRSFDSSPLWLVVMLCLGFTAGLWNVIRWAKGYNEQIGLGAASQSAQDVPDSSDPEAAPDNRKMKE